MAGSQIPMVRLARGVFLPHDIADDLHAQCLAVVAVCADDTLISDTTAGHLHGLWLPAGDSRIEVSTATPGLASRGMTRTRLSLPVRAHRRALPEPDRAVVAGIPVTSIARTWFDLSTSLGLADLVAAGDSALRRGATATELSGVIARNPHQRGVRRARAALPLLNVASRSHAESHLRVAVSRPPLPQFAVNEPIYRATGGWLAETDLSLAAAKIALEYQGADHAELARMRKDITRATDLRREGWDCLYYGPAQVYGRPWEIAPELVALVRRRAPELLLPRPRPRPRPRPPR